LNIDFLLLPAVALLGSLSFAVRGGSIPGWLKLPSTFAGRFQYAALQGGIYWYYTGDWRLCLAAIPATYIGITPGWGEIFDIGTREGPVREEAFYMAWRGLFLVWPVSIILMFISPPLSAILVHLAGMSIGLWYWAARHSLLRRVFRNNTLTAELVTGFVLSLATQVALQL